MSGLWLLACGRAVLGPPVTPEVCADRFEVGPSVLQEQRRHGPVRDFPTAIAAAVIDPDAMTPVQAVRQHQAGHTPLLWFTADRAELVVNQAALSDLTVVDATVLPPGERRLVGQRQELVRGLLDDRDLVRFLLEARVVATWIHIGASLCLVDEVRSPDGAYSVQVVGTHTFFTQEANEEPIHVVVEIDAEGWIGVLGR